jgi:hypothetical protein
MNALQPEIGPRPRTKAKFVIRFSFSLVFFSPSVIYVLLALRSLN